MLEALALVTARSFACQRLAKCEDFNLVECICDKCIARRNASASSGMANGLGAARNPLSSNGFRLILFMRRQLDPIERKLKQFLSIRIIVCF